MSDESKPREFWICEAEDEDRNTGIIVFYREPSEDEKDDNEIFKITKVIEYAAYDELKAECERLRGVVTQRHQQVTDLKQKLALAVEGLEKIASVPVAANGLPNIARETLEKLK